MKEINVVGYGGGSNSKAMIIGMQKEGIKIDYILFADPGAEMDKIYRGNDEFNEWLVKHGLPKITVVRYIHGKGAYFTLEEECLQQNKLPSIAYGGIKSCSLKWKLDPQKKFLKSQEAIQELWAEGGKVNMYVGYDAGEDSRIDNARKYDRVNKEYNNIYWLFVNGWDREKCVDVIKNEDLSLPGKSSCFFCPNMRASEIIDMALNHTEYFDRAVAMEKNAHLTKIKGLGRGNSWEELVTTWKSVIETKYGGIVTKETKAAAIDDARQVMIDRKKQIQGQSSICDFIFDDEVKASCGCYDG